MAVAVFQATLFGPGFWVPPKQNATDGTSLFRVEDLFAREQLRYHSRAPAARGGYSRLITGSLKTRRGRSSGCLTNRGGTVGTAG